MSVQTNPDILTAQTSGAVLSRGRRAVDQDGQQVNFTSDVTSKNQQLITKVLPSIYDYVLNDTLMHTTI